jgi:asparagine synthase (glutamine-hydrolysing)
MCGIFGFYRQSGLTRGDRWALRGIADAIRHRGPDGEGFHCQREVGIGMRRLAIIDIDRGWQPFRSEDGAIICVANGEIYNYVELRQQLLSRGHRLASGSDCETILHLYEERGADCVHGLRGMFAFAIIDNRAGKLVLARDRMGEKPLLLVRGDDWLAFSSEMLGLVGGGVVQPDLEPDAVRLYFHWGFVPEPLTPIRSVVKLPAGCRMVVDLATGSVSEDRYWRLSEAPVITDEPVARIRAELEEVSRITTRSDRPISVGLSSGVDSSAVASMAVRFASQPVSAISIGYEGTAFQDESLEAAQYARELGIAHHRVVLETEDVVRDFPRMCLHRDEPIADVAGSSIYSLAGASDSLGMPVLLTGLGGDELFWGYRWHRKCVEESFRAARTRAGIGSFADYLRVTAPPISAVGTLNWLQDLGGIIRGLRDRARDRQAPSDQLVFWDAVREYRDAARSMRTVGGPLLLGATANPAAIFTGDALWDDVPVALTELICNTYLMSNGLVQTDRLSMARSVEARVPLVDYKLAEVAIGIRKNIVDHALPEKALLRAALRGIVPDHVMNRRKRGFTPPWRRWTRALVARHGDQLRSGSLVQLGALSRAGAARLAAGIDLLGRPVPMALSALVLEMWLTEIRAYPGRFRADLSSEPDLPERRIDSRR